MISIDFTSFPHNPGVYQFLDSQNNVIYVGKAKDLHKRVASYFQAQKDPKTEALKQLISDIKLIVTNNEIEALLLESTLIKKFRPKFNIVFKDDKSYPYIFLSEHEFPRLTIHRGSQTQSGEYFGPYPVASAVWETIHLLQKVFGIRSCSENYFKTRVRPCIQYQIGRCSAPCVGRIAAPLYQQNVSLVKDFLRGKSKYLTKAIKTEMEQAAWQKNYELAAYYRDLYRKLQHIATPQFVVAKKGDVDAIAMVIKDDFISISVLVVRGGSVVDSRNFVSSIHSEFSYDLFEILVTFLAQYYLENGKPIPERILIPNKIANQQEFAKIISDKAKKKVVISHQHRGVNLKWLTMAKINAEQAMAMAIAKSVKAKFDFLKLQQIFKLPKMPKMVECFDISHTHGEMTVASCVVFNVNGPIKKDYRRFNVANITPGDDYAALTQALERRYFKHPLPDLLMIDGGKGQLKIAKQVLATKDHSSTTILAIAKGRERKPGKEVIYCSEMPESITLGGSSPVLHVLQRIRDEAHRFAITSHRQQLRKSHKVSVFESIPGVGPKKRTQLFCHFGSLEKIAAASVADIVKLLRINTATAEKIKATARKPI